MKNSKSALLSYLANTVKEGKGIPSIAQLGVDLGLSNASVREQLEVARQLELVEVEPLGLYRAGAALLRDRLYPRVAGGVGGLALTTPRLLDLTDLGSGSLELRLVVSHDLQLLDTAGTTVELRGGRTRVFGGNYAHYREVVDAEQAAALQALTGARNDVRAEKRDKVEAQVVLARRERYGRKMEANKREPKIVMGARKRAVAMELGELSGGRVANAAYARQAQAGSRGPGADITG